MLRQKQRDFSSGLTAESMVVTIFNLVAGLFILNTGWTMNTWWHGLHRGDPFFLLGAAIVVLVGVTQIRKFGRSIRVTDRAFIYRRRDNEIQIPWTQMRTFQKATHGKRWFRIALVGDSRHTIAIDSQSFRDFDLIVNLVDVARRRAGVRS